MADWLAPFHLPKFTDDKFEESKAKYNAKNGYTVTVPAFEDIIKYDTFPPLTEQETKLWTGKIPAAEIPTVYRSADEIVALLHEGKGPVSEKRKMTGPEMDAYRKNAKNLIPEERREQIRAEKQRKKEKYLAMLASPSPKIVRSAGAVLTALDDLQDAISTLACIGMIAAAIVGGTTAALLAGPLGWIVGAATLLQMINPYSRLKGPRGKAKTGRAAKKDLEKATDKNPFSKKSRAKLAKKIRSFKLSSANAIEALQVTAGIFGIGVSLGPLMGFAQDLVAGTIRKARGEKVSFKASPPPNPKYAILAQRALKAGSVTMGVPWHSDMSEEMVSLIGLNLALQAQEPYLAEWNAFDQVDDLANCMVEAPRPTNPLTLEIIEESGHTVDEVCNWPQNGERWITLGDLQEATAQQATDNLTHFANQNKNSVEAFIAGQNAHDFALRTIEAIEGPGQVEIEYSVIERIILIILDNGWCYPDNITDAQVEKFEDWCYVHDFMTTMPSYKDIWRYAEIFCGFRWAKSPDETR
jgi:hypothetical protein